MIIIKYGGSIVNPDGKYSDAAIDRLVSIIEENSDEKDAQDLYKKLGNVIIPMFYKNREQWLNIMQYCIAFNASFFNTHRMVHEYVLNAYFE